MRRLHRLIALAMAALWLPAVWHCGLETVANAADEQGCCTHETDQTSPAEGACMADHCSIFDDGHFKVDGEGALLLPAPDLSLAAVADAWFDLCLAAATEPVAWWPPTAHAGGRAWVFEQRAAPLANAPGHNAS